MISHIQFTFSTNKKSPKRGHMQNFLILKCNSTKTKGVESLNRFRCYRLKLKRRKTIENNKNKNINVDRKGANKRHIKH